MTLNEYIGSLKFGEFKVKPHYRECGDFLEVFFYPDAAYSERVNEYVTLHRSFKTNEIVGVKIKGLKPILAQSNLVLEQQ